MKKGLKNTKIWTASLGLMLVSVIGCGKVPGLQADQQAMELDPEVTIDNKVDVLFVIDNSLSMKPFQDSLAEAFDKFITTFSEKNLDFHVAVVSTETMGSREYWTEGKADTVKIYNKKGDASKDASNISPWPSFVNDGPGTFLVAEKDPALRNDIITGKAPRYLTRDLPHASLISQFKENVKLGGESYTAEAGILSALAALGPEETLTWWKGWLANTFKDTNNQPNGDRLNIEALNTALINNMTKTGSKTKITAWNEGFLRQGSRLVIIFMSNEDESVPMFRLNDSFDRQSPYIRQVSEEAVKSYISGSIELLKKIGGNGRRIHIASVIEDKKDDSGNITVNGQTVVGSKLGRVYKEVAEAFKGDIIDIKKPENFGEMLFRFSKKISSAITQFPLKQLVNIDSVVVCVDETIDNVRDCFEPKFPGTTDYKQKFVMKGRMLTSAEFEIINNNPGSNSSPLLNVKGTGVTSVAGAKYRIIYVPKAPTK